MNTTTGVTVISRSANKLIPTVSPLQSSVIAGSGRDRPARRLPAGGRGHQHLLLQQPELQRGHLSRGQAACSHHYLGRGAGSCDHGVLLTIRKYIFITTVQYK